MSQPKRTIRRVTTSQDPHAYIYSWLVDLAGRRLSQRDVFVPDWVDPAWFDMERVGFYFTVPSEHWSAVLVRGSDETVAMVESMEADIAEHEQDPEYDRRQLARERKNVRSLRKHEKLPSLEAALADHEQDPSYAGRRLARERQQVHALRKRGGLVSHAELHAQATCLLDGTFAQRSQIGKYRVFRSVAVEVEAFADMLADQADWLIIPVIPAFSWKEVPPEFPVDDPRYGSPMVHAETRTPCPWQPLVQERGVFV